MSARLTERRTLALLALLAFLIAFPFFGSSFWVVQIGIKTLWLGIAAISLIFLAGTVGMVSLAQTAIYGSAGYVLAHLTVMQGWNGWLAVPVALAAAVVIAAAIALISARSSGIYFLMLTLAVAVFRRPTCSGSRCATPRRSGSWRWRSPRPRTSRSAT
jgi:branched-chain amino acid transport system permease protein